VRTDLNYRVKNILYRLFQTANRWVKRFRRLANMPYWSLAATVNSSVSAAAQLIANYEAALAAEARAQGADGVVCGHIHHAAARVIDGVLYCNSGDWVDSCSALVEHADGRMEVLRWIEMQEQLQRTSQESAAAAIPMEA
jgi:UDP-2,3-diacylglucosamine pyrophosphatase LpxH